MCYVGGVRILVAVDFSECSRHACRWAVERLSTLSAHELVFHHVGDPTRLPAEEVGALEEVIAQVRTFVKETVGQKALPEGVEIRYAVSRGRPAESLIAAATTQRTDAIVMGTNGRRGLDRILLGSVAEGVVRAAPCTVVVVRPPVDA